jgi:hypothetical protein
MDVLAVGADAALVEFAAFGDDADLTGDLPEVVTDKVHS